MKSSPFAGTQILGIGTAHPPYTMSQVEAAELAEKVCCPDPENRTALKVLYRRAGVKNRHTVVPHTRALDWSNTPTQVKDAPNLGPTTAERMAMYAGGVNELAVSAGQRALEAAQVAPEAITHVITVTCTGFTAPGFDIALIDQLGLKRTTERVQVGFMGCHGSINGLRVAQGLVAAHPAARVLLCSVELCSLHYSFVWDPSRCVGNAIFADGAAAMVLGAAPQSDAPWRVKGCGSCLVPESTDAMNWQIGDHGFEMVLSPKIPDLIGQHLRPWMSAWLDSHGFGLDDIGSWAVHPGGPRILTAVEESLALNAEATGTSREVLSEFGNMSSATVLFILDRLRQRNAPRPCVALGFGPGLMAEAALFV
ncbi:MAG: type III polyketide synthase [Planctomycetes bacterium]|nr:type III polyketide synthase [Planctomycetota bacterium]